VFNNLRSKFLSLQFRIIRRSVITILASFPKDLERAIIFGDALNHFLMSTPLKYLFKFAVPKNIEVKMFDLKFASPLISASFKDDVSSLFQWQLLGIGGITYKTVLKDPSKGNNRPRIQEVRHNGRYGILNSLGLPTKGVKKFKKLINNKNFIIKKTNIRYIMSHLACGDDPRSKKNTEQLKMFREISKSFKNIKMTMANSAGVLLGKNYHFDMVRPGISIYGGNAQKNKKNTFRHVVKLTAKLIQIRQIKKGSTIGYGATYKAKQKMIIGTIGLGYADGLNRLFSNNMKCYYKKKEINLIGRVSMDLITLDLSKFQKKDIQINSRIEIINDQNNINQICKNIGTIPYEILTNLGHRYSRKYK